MPVTEQRKQYLRDWAKKNREKIKAYQKKYRDKFPPEWHSARTRKYYLPATYGITVQEYECMLEDQGRSCAICKTTKPTGKWKVFAVDHCHITNEIRGLLCNECNRGMGLLGDSIPRIQAVLDYLTNHKKKTVKEREERLSKSS